MDATMMTVRAPNKNIRITKWKVKPGQRVNQGAILCIYETDESKGLKIKATDVGTIHELLGQEGDRKPPGSVLVKIEPCKHPIVMKDMCAECGADLREEAGVAGERKEPVTATVAMVHSIPELIISEEQAKAIGKEDENRLLKTKKLVLLVDLDQTLIHTTNDTIPANLKDVFHYQLRHGPGLLWYHTRMRPGTKHFLETISKLYELHICTFGARMYAHTIARFLDPEEKYFSHRILSRDECFNPNSKTANLKALFPCGDKMVAIIDDREDVWNFAPNLIHVKPYRFFQGTADINAPPGLAKTEHDLEPVHHRVRTISRSQSVEKEATVKVNEHDDKTVESKETNIDGQDGNSNSDEAGKNKEIKDDCENIENENDGIEKKNGNNNKDNDSKCSSSGDNSELKISEDMNEQENKNKCNGLDNESHDKGLPVDCVNSSGSDTNNDLKEKQDDDTNQQNENESPDESDSDGVKDMPDNKDASQTDKSEDDVVIEWDDDDDYLLYLEEILTRIHKTFFDFYDQMKNKQEKQEMPDLKDIITYIKKKVLQGVNVVFSGVFPTNMDPEKSRAYIVARALGANIHTNIIPKGDVEKGKATTHLIAAKPGTNKVKLAQKVKGIKIVNPNWLWNCAERYERVDERLFPLEIENSRSDNVDSPDITQERPRKRKSDETELDSISEKRMRKDENDEELLENESSDINDSVPGPSENEKVDNPLFSRTYNPLLAFSDDDLACMDKEVEDIMDEDEDEISSEDDEERDSRIRSRVLSSESGESSTEDSLSGDLPRGWKKKSGSSDSPHSSDKDEVNDMENENDQDKYDNIMEAFSPDTESDDNESIGSMDDEMAAAIDREFLGI